MTKRYHCERKGGELFLSLISKMKTLMRSSGIEEAILKARTEVDQWLENKVSLDRVECHDWHRYDIALATVVCLLSWKRPVNLLKRSDQEHGAAQRKVC